MSQKSLTADLNSFERKVLAVIQSDFPLVSRPYAEVGRQVGMTEAEVLACVRGLREKGVIRRMGANFQSRAIGYKSTLCAAVVPEDKMDAFVAEVNRHPGVTHNYLRDHRFNVWFTLIAPGWDAVEETLKGVSEATGVEVLNFPSKRMYKIKVDFPMDE